MNDSDPVPLLEAEARDALTRYGRVLGRAHDGKAVQQEQQELDLAEARFLSTGRRLREAKARRHV